MLSAAGPVARSYSYDLAGNVTSDGVHSYDYNGRGRLVDAGAATYQYNALGQRVSKTVGGVTTLFAYDESGNLIGEYDAAGNAIREHVWFNGAPVAVITGSTIHYVHTDHLGTPRAVTHGGTAVWRWESDPFGSTAAQEDPDGDLTTFTYNLRFPGQYYDDETGLHYNYFRTYDPSTGRYLESDPIGLDGGLNTYGYVTQNPLRYTDPTGEAIPLAVACAANPVACGTLLLATGVTVYNFGQDAAGILAGSKGTIQTHAMPPLGIGADGEITDDRTVPSPPRRGGQWTAICRADCNDNIVGNCPDPSGNSFALGAGVGNDKRSAKQQAKRDAQSKLQCQAKHTVSCRCTSPGGQSGPC